MNILICLLGLSPGVVTGAYYALARDRGIVLDRLVTVGTGTGSADACEREIIVELERSGQVYPDLRRPAYDYDFSQPLAALPRYDPAHSLASYRDKLKVALETDAYGNPRAVPAGRLRIPYEDVVDEASATALRETLLVLVRDLYPTDDVFLCTAGGRKSMAAIAMLAAQLGPGVRRLFHVHNSELRAEAHGSVEDADWPTWDNDGGRLPFLRPRPEKLALVDIPFFRIQPGKNGPELFLPVGDEDESADRFMLEYLAQNQLWVMLDAAVETRIVTGFFEERVRDHLEDLDHQARRSPTNAWLKQSGIHVPLSEKPRADGRLDPKQIDVVGIKDGEVVLIECKCHLPGNGRPATLERNDVVQAAALLRTHLDPPLGKLRVWLVTTATEEWPEDWAAGERAIPNIDALEIYSADEATIERLRQARWGKQWRNLLLEARGRLKLRPLGRRKAGANVG
jgi:hypothetical protein